MDLLTDSNSIGYDASQSSADSDSKTSRVWQRPHTISNAELFGKHGIDTLYDEQTNRPLPVRTTLNRKTSQKRYGNNKRQLHQTSKLIHNISERVADYSQNGLYSLRVFVDSFMKQIKKNNLNNTTDLHNVLHTIQQTNESMKLLHNMWFKTILSVMFAIAIFCVLAIIPVILSFIWLALGFEFADKNHYFYTVFWFFAIWILLSLSVCSIVAVLYSRKPS